MQPIGIFDSGYGGLSVFRKIADKLPQYDYIYLGDNARAPYGSRSFETVYEYTLECVLWLFQQGCPLVILACNTASAKALRTIQQKDLPLIAPDKRVLGVIRPTTEIIGQFSKTKKVGILGTQGTITSYSYPIEIAKYFPDIKVYQHACPLWVPFVEEHAYLNDEIDPFIERDIQALFTQDKDIDTVLLACTHYPLLSDRIKKFLPKNITLLSQGELVADSLAHYLNHHSEIENKISKGQQQQFFTSDAPADFEKHATLFFGKSLIAKKAIIPTNC